MEISVATHARPLGLGVGLAVACLATACGGSNDSSSGSSSTATQPDDAASAAPSVDADASADASADAHADAAVACVVPAAAGPVVMSSNDGDGGVLSPLGCHPYICKQDSSSCPTGDYFMLCGTDDMAEAAIPSPDPSLGCTAIEPQNPPDAQYYYCPCQ